MRNAFRLSLIFFFIFHVTCDSGAQTISQSNTTDILAEELSLFKNDEQLELTTGDEFAYLATKGQEFALKKDFRRSNEYFEQAYLLRLDGKEHFFNRDEEWYDEIHEVVILLYLKTLNYLEMGSMEDALVECKRLNEWIHPQKDNDISRKLEWNDPLVHMLMALLYDVDGNYDDAWIDYHHASGIYNAHYKNLFSKHPPKQLTLRSLALDPAFQWVDQLAEPNNGELILFWNNGRSPVEHVENQDFKIRELSCNDGTVKYFRNYAGDTILSFFDFSRPFYHSSKLVRGDEQERCELLEDLTWYSVRKTNERLHRPGTHVWRKGRSWSTMPGNIYYAVVPLAKGQNTFTFTMVGDGVTKEETFSAPGDGRSHFYTVTTLESVAVAQPVTTNLLSTNGTPQFSIVYTGGFSSPNTSPRSILPSNPYLHHKK